MAISELYLRKSPSQLWLINCFSYVIIDTNIIVERNVADFELFSKQVFLMKLPLDLHIIIFLCHKFCKTKIALKSSTTHLAVNHNLSFTQKFSKCPFIMFKPIKTSCLTLLLINLWRHYHPPAKHSKNTAYYSRKKCQNYGNRPRSHRIIFYRPRTYIYYYIMYIRTHIENGVIGNLKQNDNGRPKTI